MSSEPFHIVRRFTNNNGEANMNEANTIETFCDRSFNFDHENDSKNVVQGKRFKPTNKRCHFCVDAFTFATSE